MEHCTRECDRTTDIEELGSWCCWNFLRHSWITTTLVQKKFPFFLASPRFSHTFQCRAVHFSYFDEEILSLCGLDEYTCNKTVSVWQILLSHSVHVPALESILNSSSSHSIFIGRVIGTSLLYYFSNCSMVSDVSGTISTITYYRSQTQSACFSPAFNHHLARVPKNVDFSVYFGYCAKKTFLRTHEFLHVSSLPKNFPWTSAIGHVLSGIIEWDKMWNYRIHFVSRFRDEHIQGIIFPIKKTSDHDNYFKCAVLNVKITVLAIVSFNYLMNNDKLKGSSKIYCWSIFYYWVIICFLVEMHIMCYCFLN